MTGCVWGEEEDDATTGDRWQQQACEKSSSTFAIWSIVAELLATDKHLIGHVVSNCQFHLVYLFFPPSRFSRLVRRIDRLFVFGSGWKTYSQEYTEYRRSAGGVKVLKERPICASVLATQRERERRTQSLRERGRGFVQGLRSIQTLWWCESDGERDPRIGA